MISIEQLVQALSQGYMMRQAAVITALFVTGLAVTFALGIGESNKTRAATVLYAFPSGLAVFSVLGYLMLCLGIPYNALSVTGAVIAVVIAAVVIGGIKVKSGYIKLSRRMAISALLVVVSALAISIMLTVNIFDVAVDNDSFFYFSAYPNAIVSEGAYSRYFDVFLTDAAPIGSIIQTLPFLFGFNETFGIQYFMDLNFVLIFLYALNTELGKRLSDKTAMICALTTTIFLVTSSAYLTTAKWVMAGVYFMSYYFITAYLAYNRELPRNGRGQGILPGNGRGQGILLALMTVMTAMMRHEGVMLILVLVVTLAALKKYDAAELLSYCIGPMFIASALYYIRVFVILGVKPLYAFLTPPKALLMSGSILICGLGLFLLRNRLKRGFGERLLFLIPGTALAINVLLAAVRGERYLDNFRMFYLNVRIGAGWGYFAYIAGAAVLGLIIRAIVKKERYLTFFDSLMLSYVLSVILVSFGRGDSLRKGVGDSGNRVMLTAVPLIVFAVALRMFEKGGESRAKTAEEDGAEDQAAGQKGAEDQKTGQKAEDHAAEQEEIKG
ncbi:MAG: hypothetical protein K6G42_00455 [Lachnospiraceae bacterium]|nr:hypothetical protein [Lachnospiraceae bacterium]